MSNKQTKPQTKQKQHSTKNKTMNATNTTNAKNSKMEAFTFGDPEPVMDARAIWDYMECGFNGHWFEPPVPFEGLSRTFRANPHHEAAMRFKRNLLVKTFIPHRLLGKQQFSAWALDFLTYGNAYIEKRTSYTGNTLELVHALGKFMRRGKDLDNYFFVHNAPMTGLPQNLPYSGWEPFEFDKGSIFHLLEPDINQEVYGLPEYLSALQSIWLNEEATLFRRKYYKNGSHAGFILYMNDPKIATQDVDAIRKQLRESKGLGNFKNLFLHAPGGGKEGVQLIPIGEVAARDEFLNIKKTSCEDILVVHRVPPQLLGVVPQNAGGFGSIKDATQVFMVNEIVPLQDRFKELNDWIGDEVVRFIDVEDYIAQLGKGSQSTGDRLASAIRDAVG